MIKRINILVVVVLIVMSFCLEVTNAVSYKTMTLNKTLEIIYDNKTQEFYDVSGKKVHPISYEGTTYLPIRAITSMFDMTISWDSTNNTVYMSTEPGDGENTSARETEEFVAEEAILVSALINDEITIQFNNEIQKFSDVNGKIVYPLSYHGTTYLPIRAISNLYHAKIEWNGEKNQIIIEKPTNDIIEDNLPNKEQIDASDKNFDYTATYINNENKFAEITLERQSSKKVLFSIKGVTLSGSGYVARYPVTFENGVAHCEQLDLKIYLSGNKVILETTNESRAILNGVYSKEINESRTIIVTKAETNQWNGTYKKSDTITMDLGELSSERIAIALTKVDKDGKMVTAIGTIIEKIDDKNASGTEGEFGEIKKYKLTFFDDDKIEVTLDTGNVIVDKLFNGAYVRKEFTPREVYLKVKDALEKTSLGEGVTGHMFMGS